MTIKKSIEIPLDEYYFRLADPKFSYTNEESRKLERLYNLFQEGKFKECVTLTESWSSFDREMIPCDIWDILLDVSMGQDAYSI